MSSRGKSTPAAARWSSSIQPEGTPPQASTTARTDEAAHPILVGGLGLPWLRDLDFGTQFVRRVSEMEWPDSVRIEDLSYAAHRVLDTVRAIAPRKVVLVGAMPRDVDPPGTIRRYELDLTPPPDEEVADRLSEAIGGIIDLDHTLAVVRYWQGFPPGSVVIEVEPGDRSFGLGLSDEVEAIVDTVLAMVRQEVDSSIEEVKG